jgi:hypothetical protein
MCPEIAQDDHSYLGAYNLEGRTHKAVANQGDTAGRQHGSLRDTEDI